MTAMKSKRVSARKRVIESIVTNGRSLSAVNYRKIHYIIGNDTVVPDIYEC